MTDVLFNQIHLIPFDLGCSFIDPLSVNNLKNFLFAQEFVNNLSKAYENTDIIIKNNFEICESKKIKFYKNEIADNSICFVILNTNLCCYILSNGIGIFVLADFDNKALSSDVHNMIKKQNIAMVAAYQKKLSQSAILNKFQGYDVFPEAEKEMFRFREKCWEIVCEGVKNQKVNHLRKYSGNKAYKNDGLSYVLTIHVFNKQLISDREINFLMYSNTFSNVMDVDKWKTIGDEINNNEMEIKKGIKAPNSEVYFAWSGVAVVLPELLSNYDDLINTDIICALIKTEMYVQSRWFIADNCMDNVNKSMNCTLESLQRIESLIEFSQAELDNEISANMNTLQKNLLKDIVETSEVHKLYKSVINQIHTQRKIKEAHYADKKSRNRLIANCFLAIFTAASLYKTVKDIWTDSFDWKALAIFLGMLAVAIGTVVWDYKNK